MKYIMIETANGQKLPFIFPEAITHLHMAAVVEVLLPTIKTEGKVVSAGFISCDRVAVFGESESLGGIQSVPADAARIMIGDSVAFMPDALAEVMLDKLRKAK